MPKSAARRRYLKRFLVAMGCYVVALGAAETMIDGQGLAGPFAVAVAILPALPILAVFWAIGRLLVEERDEYLRDQLVRQSLIATAFALSVATVWGFLEAFGLAPHVDSYFVAVLWFAGLGIGGLVNWLARPTTEEEPA